MAPRPVVKFLGVARNSMRTQYESDTSLPQVLPYGDLRVRSVS